MSALLVGAGRAELASQRVPGAKPIGMDALDPICTVATLLREASLSHLEAPLKAKGATLRSLEAKLDEGRTPFLAYLKGEVGLTVLKDRQALCTGLAKAKKYGRLQPAADESEADAANAAAAEEAAVAAEAFSLPTLADLPTLPRQPHIVCLHGGGACAAVLRVQLSRLLAQLGPLGAEVSHIEGGRMTCFDQAMLASVIAASGAQPADLRDWFVTIGDHYNVFSFSGFDEAIEHAEHALARLIDKKQRPVDVLLGFSQGADLALMLAARHLTGASTSLLPMLRGLVLLEADHPFINCGWAVSLRDSLFAAPLPIRSLVVGATKTVYPRKGAADEVATMLVEPSRVDFADVHRPLPQDRADADRISATIVRFVWEAVATAGAPVASVPVGASSGGGGDPTNAESALREEAVAGEAMAPALPLPDVSEATAAAAHPVANESVDAVPNKAGELTAVASGAAPATIEDAAPSAEPVIVPLVRDVTDGAHERMPEPRVDAAGSLPCSRGLVLGCVAVIGMALVLLEATRRMKLKTR